MRTPRVYINQDLSINTIVNLPKESAEHLAKVIKRKAGNQIILFNGLLDNNNKYGDYTAEITEIKRNNITVRVLNYIETSTLQKPILELAQCISKPAHFEVTLQKSVELGVNTITPIISSRSEQIIKQDNSDKKMGRWQKIIISACEQCGRSDVPILNQPVDINYWVNNLKSKSLDTKKNILLTLCTKTNNSLHHLEFDNDLLDKISLIIGPEGGLDDNEINLLQQNSFNLVKLGQRIMRTETAGIASLAILQFLVGNL